MREIKFRIWHKDKNRFLNTSELKCFNISPVDGHVLFLDGHDCVDTLVPLQFTGLKDIEGKEIYEGDIVRIDTGLICKVVCLNTNSGFELFEPKQKWYFETQRVEKVIGNIYENRVFSFL